MSRLKYHENTLTDIKCIHCKTEYVKKGSRRYCSHKCYSDSIRGIVTSIFWDTASEEEKLERIKRYFEKKVIRKDGCWDWKGCRLQGGYGGISIRGKNKPASRISWIIHHGEVPNGLFVLHKCDNPLCTNPDHLFLGTTKDNAEDRSKKGRNRNQDGELNNSAILNSDQVKEIRDLIKNGVSYNEISLRFNIAKPTISNIKSGKTWRHIL